MADETQETTPETTDEAQQGAEQQDLGDAGKRALEAERDARKEAVKAQKKLEAELAQLRQANLSETERAVEEARAAGRVEASSDFGKRLARTEFDAMAGRRNPDVDTNAVLEYVDLGRFIDENGEPDSKAIKAAVERLVPEPSGTPGDPKPPSLDLGHRPSSALGKRTNADIFADLMKGQLK